MTPKYKTSRKHKCPYCDLSASRENLVNHVDRQHFDLLPEGYTASRAVYDAINKKNFGTCMICKSKVYEWNDKINRYRNLCNNPRCRAKVRENALERHIRVYNKPTLLNDSEWQEKMLANRRISGTYTFSDGTKMVYTGKYERNALEFMDAVLGIPAKDIQAPGPVLEYEYNGEAHKWITDIYYIPANLIIEIKDGGSNPNNRNMTSYREKQVAKETMVTNMGTFNYIRLTNNNFAQLLDVLADIKNGVMEVENPKMKIHINEEVGGLPRNGPPEAYIVPYGMNNAFTGSPGLAYSDSDMDEYLIIDEDGCIIPISKKVFNERYQVSETILVYNKPDASIKMNSIRELCRKSNNGHKWSSFVEILSNRSINRWQDALLCESFKYYDRNMENEICKLIENAVANGLEIRNNTDTLYTSGNVHICRSPKGYYACTNGFSMSSDFYNDLESLQNSGVIDLMKNIYNSNSESENGGDENA